MSKVTTVVLYIAFTLIALYSTVLYASLFDDEAKQYVALGLKFIITILDRWFWMFT